MTTAQEQAREDLGQAIDRVENLAAALRMPLPDALHVAALRSALPEAARNLKAAFVQVTGENPWE